MLLSKVLTTGIGALTLVALAATNAVAAPSGTTALAPKIGVRYFSESGGQCGSPQENQWAAAGTWTTAIRLDTDNQGGGCKLGFGLLDESSVLTGLSLNYKWQVNTGGDPNQCGEEAPANTPEGVNYTVLPAPFEVFGPTVRVDTDGRAGWCNLTFTLAGRTDTALDVEYLREVDNGQCKNWLPPGQFHRVSVFTPPVTIGDDTDDRSGGCTLRFRLMKF